MLREGLHLEHVLVLRVLIARKQQEQQVHRACQLLEKVEELEAVPCALSSELQWQLEEHEATVSHL